MTAWRSPRCGDGSEGGAEITDSQTIGCFFQDVGGVNGGYALSMFFIFSIVIQ